MEWLINLMEERIVFRLLLRPKACLQEGNQLAILEFYKKIDVIMLEISHSSV